jgi:hypothetical protein
VGYDVLTAVNIKMLTDVSMERAASMFRANIYQGTRGHVPDGNILLFDIYIYGCKTWSLTPREEIGCRCYEILRQYKNLRDRK